MLALLVLVAGAALLARPRSVPAQTSAVGELVTLGANALLGGLTAGLAAPFHDSSFLEGMGEGMLGGSVVYLGKRLSAADFAGAGLAGRVVGAAGAAVVRNSAGGREPLERVVLPVGPVSVYLTLTPDSQSIRPRINLGRSISLALLALHDGYQLDWALSFSSGAPMFRGDGVVIGGGDGRVIGGLELLGAVRLSDSTLVPYPDPRRLYAHERVHVVQDDFVTFSWANPAEDWVLGNIPGGDVIRRYVDTDLVYIGIGLIGVALLPYEGRPWELEADYLDEVW